MEAFFQPDVQGKKPFLLLQNLRGALASLTVSEPYRFRKSLGKKMRFAQKPEKKFALGIE